MKEQNWLMRVTTILAAFCAFMLADIYRDFKQVREDVLSHKYQIKGLNDDMEAMKKAYYMSISDRTYVKQKIR